MAQERRARGWKGSGWCLFEGFSEDGEKRATDIRAKQGNADCH